MEYLVVMTTLLLSLYDVTAVLPSVSYDVTEESTSTIVGNIMADAGLYGSLGPEVVKDLRFRITDETMDDLLTIDDVTGIIRLKTVLDREVICSSPLLENSCKLTFDVAATKSNPDFYDVVTVTINILDINDNIPKFPSKRHHIIILESANPPVAFNLPLAKDADTTANGIKSYSLQSTEGIFELNVIESAGTIRAVQLVLTEEVDRELKSSYEVSLLANDGGQEPGSLLINITVSDANDHVPQFVKDSYVIYIAEDVPASSTLLTVQATDEDIGINSQIVYSLATASEMYSEHFYVDKDSGDIILIKPLDYELVPVYNLIIQAEDGGTNSQQAYCDVMINVSDVNDQAPVITINTLAGKSRAEVSESAEPGQFVAHVSVKDLDTGAGGEFTCYCDNLRFELKTSSTTRFDLITTASLDREEQAEIIVEVICSDKGLPILTSSKLLTVSVQDANDNPPVFSQESYTHTIEENNMIGAELFKVSTTDADFGMNAQVSYSVKDDRIKIDLESGMIRANNVFDYEDDNRMVFEVIAKDNGVPTLSSTATVTLYIQDVNDEAPVFTKEIYNFKVAENQLSETEVGTISATDADSYPFNVVSYALAGDSDLFYIEEESGVIKTSGPLDRETRNHHILEVVASNARAVPPLSSTVTINIEVTDVNDNAPIIDYPSLENDTVIISNLLPEGLVITQVKGHDDDNDLENVEGQGLHFNIAKGNFEGYFDINRESGIITSVKSLENFQLETFELLISVSDNGNPPLGSERVLKIIVDQSVPFEGQKMLVGNNLLVVVVLSAASAIVVLLLIVGIIVLKKRDIKKKQDKLESSRYTIDFEQRDDTHVDLSIISTMIQSHPKDTAVPTDAHQRAEARSSVSSYQLPHPEQDDTRERNSWPSSQQNLHHSSSQHAPSVSSKSQQQLTVMQCYDQRRRTLSDHDTDSAYSGELSNSDSGRGLSIDYHDCSYGYGSYMERPAAVTSSQENNDVINIGYFDNRPMKIPQTISQRIMSNRSIPIANNQSSKKLQSHQYDQDIAVQNHKSIPNFRNRTVQEPAPWKDSSFTDSVQSLDSGPDDDTSSTSGSYVIDFDELDLEDAVYVPRPVSVTV